MTPEAINQAAWDRRARTQDRYVDTATDADFKHPLKTADPYAWLGPSVKGRRILCLAAGGGRHAPLFAAAGAAVTVVDLSADMLAVDRQLAQQRTLHIRTIQASMADLADRNALAEETFDAVFQPVSTCYVPPEKLPPTFAGVARLLVDGGQYLSFHKQPPSLQAAAKPIGSGSAYPVTVPANHEGPLPPEDEHALHREHGTLEYLHPLASIIGSICRAGFVIEDLVEPRHGRLDASPGTFAHRSAYLPPFFGLKARRHRSTPSRANQPTPLILEP